MEYRYKEKCELSFFCFPYAQIFSGKLRKAQSQLKNDLPGRIMVFENRQKRFLSLEPDLGT